MTKRISLRLAEHLFSEHLLDQDHYLDWLIRSIEVSDLDNIPIRLLVQQIHQQELLQHRQRGRRLAGAIVKQLHNVSTLDLLLDHDQTLTQPLVIPTRQQGLVRLSLTSTN